MYTENGLLVDLAEVEKVVDLCDVFTIIFRLFPERLLVDGRTSPQEGPLVALVEPVATVEERYHWLGRERPSFGPPEQLHVLPLAAQHRFPGAVWRCRPHPPSLRGHRLAGGGRHVR